MCSIRERIKRREKKQQKHGIIYPFVDCGQKKDKGINIHSTRKLLILNSFIPIRIWVFILFDIFSCSTILSGNFYAS